MRDPLFGRMIARLEEARRERAFRQATEPPKRQSPVATGGQVGKRKRRAANKRARAARKRNRA